MNIVAFSICKGIKYFFLCTQAHTNLLLKCCHFFFQQQMIIVYMCSPKHPSLSSYLYLDYNSSAFLLARRWISPLTFAPSLLAVAFVPFVGFISRRLDKQIQIQIQLPKKQIHLWGSRTWRPFRPLLVESTQKVWYIIASCLLPFHAVFSPTVVNTWVARCAVLRPAKNIKSMGCHKRINQYWSTTKIWSLIRCWYGCS